jgi:hypothetical protein
LPGGEDAEGEGWVSSLEPRQPGGGFLEGTRVCVCASGGVLGTLRSVECSSAPHKWDEGNLVGKGTISFPGWTVFLAWSWLPSWAPGLGSSY